MTLPPVDPEAGIKLNCSENPWKRLTKGEHSEGWKFYNAALINNPSTVEEVLDLAKAAGFTRRAAQGHIRWLYACGNCEIDGKHF
jgi:hypothetical protein